VYIGSKNKLNEINELKTKLANSYRRNILYLSVFANFNVNKINDLTLTMYTYTLQDNLFLPFCKVICVSQAKTA
jgi:hypothetical protein